MAAPGGRDVPNLRDGYTVNNATVEFNADGLNALRLLNKLAKNHFGSVFNRPFMFSRHYIGDNDDNAHWQPERFLGEGGYGRVGLWVKLDDATSQTVDQMVIKETRRHQLLEWQDAQGQNVEGLATEAVVQHLMNHNDLISRDNVVHLRRYKYFPAPQVPQWRLFLEHAPYGDAGILLERYRQVTHRFVRIWNQHLSELFLWHVFHSLALVMRDMAYGRMPWRDFNDLTDSTRLPNHNMIHFDLKPDNIFFGGVVAPTVADPTSHYPTVKVGDFGLAELKPHNFNRPFRPYWDLGTPGFIPPEQRQYGKQWQNPPNRYDFDPARPTHGNIFVSDKHNVYGIGKIMHDLLMLAEPQDVEDQEPGETLFWDQNGFDENIVPPIQTRPIGAQRYSRELRDLIRRCLKPVVEDRPTPSIVVAETAQHLAQWKQKGTNAQDRVAFTVAEMNAMPEGDASITPDDAEFQRFRFGNLRQLDEPMLRPPQDGKWREFYRKYPQRPEDLAWVQNNQPPHLHVLPNGQVRFRGNPVPPQQPFPAPQPAQQNPAPPPQQPPPVPQPVQQNLAAPNLPGAPPPPLAPPPPPVVPLTAARFANTALDHRNGLKPVAVQARIRADALRLYNMTHGITWQRPQFYIVLAGRH